MNTYEEGFFQGLIDEIPAYIYWKDNECKILGCNLRQATALGFASCDELIGKSDFDLYSESKATAIHKNDMAVINSGTTHRTKENIIIKGEERVVFSVKRRITLKSGAYGILGISIDVTSEDMLEKKLKVSQVELEEKNKILIEAIEEKEQTLSHYLQFVEDQEHDVRTPITGLVGGADALADEFAMAKKEGRELRVELLEGIVECMQISSHQAQDYQESVIFDLYAGKFEGVTIFARFDLLDLSRRAFDFDLAAATMKNLEYTYIYDKSIPVFLMGDSKIVYQCILDLLGNAIKFTEHGKIEFSLKLLSCTDKQAIVRFRVKDTGIGIPRDKLGSIHLDFVKVEASNRGGKYGRGRGLNRVYEYAKNIGGELNIKSTEGKGSSFSLILPFDISLDQTNDG